MTRCTIKTGIRSTICFMLMMLIFQTNIKAQNSTSSPFSRFGIGEIETRDFGRTAGMGNVGTGVQSRNFLNHRNPAGLSGIDTLTFILDVSAAVKLSEFSVASQSERTTDFNFKNLAVGVRLSKRWTSSVGLSPFSNVGYNLKGRQPIESTNNYMEKRFSGSGGVNKFYWANAYEPFRGLSLGVTSSYLFGNIVHNEDDEVLSDKITSSINKIYFDFGLQYSYWFGQFTKVTVGGTYGYQTGISITRTNVLADNVTNTILRDQRLADTKSYIPESYGGGLSIMRNKGDAEWLLAVDYQYQKWSADHSLAKSLAYTDSRVYGFGLQVTPNTKRPTSYLQAIRFQVGACYNQSYLMVNEHQLDDYSVSVGLGFPFRNRSYVNIAANIGQSMTGHRGGITERYALISVNLSLIEIWFAKQEWN